MKLMEEIKENIDSHIFSEKMTALFELAARCDYYAINTSYYGPIIEGMAKTKGRFIIEATSKTQIAEALAVSKIHYNYSEVVPSNPERHCIEEELIGWMQCISNQKIFHEAAIARIAQVWKECREKYPELPDIDL